MPLPEPYSQGEIDIATDQAMITLLWQAGDMTDDEGNITGKIWDEEYSVDDFHPSMRPAMRQLLASFMETYLADLLEAGLYAGWENRTENLARIGHDYVLTTGGHGAGFWDRGLGDVGDRLTEACHADRHEWSLYESADGTVWCPDLEGYEVSTEATFEEGGNA